MFVFVGTYTRTTSRGIYGFEFDQKTGEIRSYRLLSEAENPSFLALDPKGKHLYCVNEVAEWKGASGGAVSGFEINPNDRNLSFINSVSTGGAGPCHLAFTPAGKSILVANYDGGSIACLPVEDNGSLKSASEVIQYRGKGKNPQRQEAAHAHSINLTPNGFAYVADLGRDKVITYKLNESEDKLREVSAGVLDLKAGSGPRHMCFSEDFGRLFLANELSSEVSTINNNQGRLTLEATTTTLPDAFTGENTVSEIALHPNGKFLYVGNRGHDSISLLRIDQRSGSASFIGCFPSEGKTPRHFAISPNGNFLLAANQDSDSLTVFSIDQDSGWLQMERLFKHESLASPVCLAILGPY